MESVNYNERLIQSHYLEALEEITETENRKSQVSRIMSQEKLSHPFELQIIIKM